jgi:hemerythrin superfamily protein
MNPIQMLKRQHREVEALFKQVDKAERPAERRGLLQEIEAKLRLHMRLEEEVFYPAVREIQSKKAEEMVAEAYEEHGVVKLVMDQLPQVDLEDERFHAKMTVMSELVKHHVDEEEQEMFKLAQKLEREEMAEIGERMASMAGPAAAAPRAGGGRGRGSRRAA